MSLLPTRPKGEWVFACRPAGTEFRPLAAPGSGVAFELAMRVDDVDARATELAERGVSLAFGPVDRPWGVRHIAFRDPDGHLRVHSADIAGD